MRTGCRGVRVVKQEDRNNSGEHGILGQVVTGVKRPNSDYILNETLFIK
jgi:hypothetical protein